MKTRQKKPLERLLAALLMLYLLAGCSAIPGLREQGTPTPNPTLLAIESMLTATAAIPTVTNTPLPTITPLPGPPPTPTTEPPAQGQIGQVIAAKDIALTVVRAAVSKELGEQAADDGMTFLDMEVVIKNQTAPGGALLPFTPFYFNLTGPTGEQYTVYTFPQEAFDKGLPPRLLGGDLLPEEMVRGHITFQTPENASDLTLRFTPPSLTANALPPVFAVTVGQVESSIPATGDDTTGAPDSTEAWLSESLPRQDKLVQHSGASLKIELARSADLFEGKKAPNGTRFLILDAVIRNDSLPKVPFNPLYFKVKDELGVEYPSTILPGDIMLQAGSLAEGQTAKGIVIFQLPERVQRVGVIYQPQVIAQDWEAFRVVINVP